MKVDGVHNPTAFMQLDEDPEGVLGEAVDVVVPEGHFALMSSVIPHKGGTNSSDVMRWSFDMRWIDARLPAGFPTVPVSRPHAAGWQPDYKYRDNLGPGMKHKWSDHKMQIHMKQVEERARQIEELKRGRG
jgi:hypothetical protein